MTMFYTPREENYLKDRQDGVENLYKCTDGVMRTAYEQQKFEERVEWKGIGFIVRDDERAADTGGEA
jgi:hypothetical protein